MTVLVSRGSSLDCDGGNGVSSPQRAALRAAAEPGGYFWTFLIGFYLSCEREALAAAARPSQVEASLGTTSLTLLTLRGCRWSHSSCSGNFWGDFSLFARGSWTLLFSCFSFVGISQSVLASYWLFEEASASLFSSVCLFFLFPCLLLFLLSAVNVLSFLGHWDDGAFHFMPLWTMSQRQSWRYF